jgi:hypothetical protein
VALSGGAGERADAEDVGTPLPRISHHVEEPGGALQAMAGRGSLAFGWAMLWVLRAFARRRLLGDDDAIIGLTVGPIELCR